MAFNPKRVAIGVATAIPVLMTLMSAAMKFSGSPEIVAALTSVGVVKYINVLGLMEAVFAILFLIPQTMRLGLLLLTSYFAGAMATDLSHGHPLINAAMILALVWIAAFLRDRSTFLPPASPPSPSPASPPAVA